MDEKRVEYDAAERILRYVAPEGEDRFPVPLARELAGLRGNTGWKGQPVDAVRVRFASESAARSNADALAYLKVDAEGPTGEVVPAAAFRARTDFGLPDA